MLELLRRALGNIQILLWMWSSCRQRGGSHLLLFSVWLSLLSYLTLFEKSTIYNGNTVLYTTGFVGTDYEEGMQKVMMAKFSRLFNTN